MNKGFLFRRLGFLMPCVLRLFPNTYIKLANKHQISSFQDVYLNPFYWDALLKIDFKPKHIFDLGANFGLFSSLCQQVLTYKGESTDDISYTLIEANKNLVNILKERINDLLPNIEHTLLFGAAGPKENIRFNHDHKNLLASKISNDGEEVAFIDFNLLTAPDLLKIDIEGAETLLLNNFSEWVFKARAIIIEFHINGNTLKEYEEKIKNAGFQLHINREEQSGYTNQLWIKTEF